MVHHPNTQTLKDNFGHILDELQEWENSSEYIEFVKKF